MKEKIVFACGGTLGHILPAVSFAHMLKEEIGNKEIIFIMTSKDEKYDFIKKDLFIDKIYYYDINGLNRKKPFSNINNLFKILKTIKKIKRVIFDSTVVIGMGGYISAIVIKVAKKLKKRVVIHEQNRVLGLANKLVYKDVDLVLSAFPLDKVNSIVIGNPRLNEAKAYLSENSKENYILVTSGSLGSEYINNLMVDYLKTIESRKYYTILITGRKYYETVKAALGNEGEHYKILPFVDNLLEYATNVSLIISRAGATTIFEIIGLEVPSIIIPSPNVANNHQYYNGLYLKEKEACVLLNETEINLEVLNKYIKYAINNSVLKDNLKNIKASYKEINISEVINNVRK